MNGNVPVYGAAARGVTEEDLKTSNASLLDAVGFANLVADSSVVSF